MADQCLGRAGEFENAAEVARVALREFITRRPYELMQQQQLRDVAWAIRDKAAGARKWWVAATGPLRHLGEAGER